MARAEAKIKDGAAPYLEPGEEVLAAIVARPRGWTQSNASPGGGAVAGAIGGMLGGKKQQENLGAAEESGFEIASPMALAVTNRRLLSLKISNPVGLGIGGDVKELVSAAPLGEVDSIELKRLAVEILPIFEARDVHREALATLVVFQRACEQERLTIQLATQLAAKLRRDQPSPA